MVHRPTDTDSSPDTFSSLDGSVRLLSGLNAFNKTFNLFDRTYDCATVSCKGHTDSGSKGVSAC